MKLKLNKLVAPATIATLAFHLPSCEEPKTQKTNATEQKAAPAPIQVEIIAGENYSEVVTIVDERTVRYSIENKSSEIALNPTNAFFDHGSFYSSGKSPAPEHERDFIREQFTDINVVKAGTIRWHVWAKEAGKLTLSPSITDLNSEQWELKVNDRPYEIQAEKLTSVNFESAGKHTIYLNYKGAEKTKSLVKGIKLDGDLADKVHVIRSRWRPSAIHCKFSSSTCPTTKLWVFESQNASPFSSYSPMTTAFGYYGASFGKEGASESMNFSMWIASKKKSEVPPMDQTPHLLATGSPTATFGGFGHEGTGVKIRDFITYPHRPKSVIQALRLEIKNGYNVYSGYFFDEPSQEWVLFATGRKPVRAKRPITSLRATSFCEVPGPPSRQRSGDLARVIKRRGWFYGEDEQWHPVDTVGTGTKGFSNKSIFSGKDGWLKMATGGVEKYNGEPVYKAARTDAPLPIYLAKNKTAKLFQLPATIKTSKLNNITSNSAEISYNIPKAGTNALATIYYDTKDCISFTPRKLHGTERNGLSSKLFAHDRTWQHSTTAKPIKSGENTFQINDLKPNTTYFYRVYIRCKDGQTWAEEAGSFTTSE